MDPYAGGGMDPYAGGGGGSGRPDADHKQWLPRVLACKRSVCLVAAHPVGRAEDSMNGTGWVVRNGVDVAALVTARHVVQRCIGPGGRLTAGVEATFDNLRTKSLRGALVREVPEPGAGADAPGAPPLDVVAIVLEPGVQFPAPPVPCVPWDAVPTATADSAECTLFHHPDVNPDVVVAPRGRVVPPPDNHPDAHKPWVVFHDAPTEGGSSGGMLVDRQCRAFAVHVRRTGPAKKAALLLSALDNGLGESSPWFRIGRVVHVAGLSFRLPARYAHFVGREWELAELRRLVRELRRAVVYIGLAGVGKTLLATEFVHEEDLSGAYAVVAWLRADSLDNLYADLLELAERLDLPVRAVEGKAMAERAEWVTWSLEKDGHGRMLLAYDNAQDYKALKPFVPVADHCHTIFTARNGLLFPDDCVLRLPPFDAAESLELVRRLLGRKLVGAERSAAEQLCAEVGGLPLAVGQLTLHAKVSGVGLPVVLRAVLEKAAAAGPLGKTFAAYGKSVIAALQLVQEQHLDTGSAQTLRRLALVAPDRVPRALLGPDADTHTLGALAMVSFPEPGFVSIHRLVQKVARDGMSAEDRLQASLALLDAADQHTRVFSWHERRSWDTVRAVAAHAEALLCDWMPPASAGADVAETWWRVVRRLYDYHSVCLSDCVGARRWAERLRTGAEALFPGDAVRTLVAVRETMNALWQLRQFEEALSVCDEVLPQCVAALGEDHVSVARTQHEMAVVMERQGQLTEALALFEVVLGKEVAALREDHVDVATTQHEMASVMQRQGKLTEALALFEVVLRKKVASLGEDHVDVATTQYEMAVVMKRQGKLTEALALFEAVVRKKVAALGEDHLDVARTQHEMAVVMQRQGQLTEALALFEAVVRKKVAALGEDHVDVATTQYEMAVVMSQQRKLTEALALFEVVLRKRVTARGEDHVSVARTQYEMAVVMQRQGKLTEALALLEGALQKFVAANGEANVETVAARALLAEWTDASLRRGLFERWGAALWRWFGG